MSRRFARTLAGGSSDDGLRSRLSRRAHYRAVPIPREMMGREMMRLYALRLRLHRPRRESGGMRIVYFTHSLRSCWNHGNAHFLRGVLRELVHAGHEVLAFEPKCLEPRATCMSEQGAARAMHGGAFYPELSVARYGRGFAIEEALDGADLVIVHEWNAPGSSPRIGALRRRGAALHAAVPRHAPPGRERA
jgi:hypothetical protein